MATDPRRDANQHLRTIRTNKGLDPRSHVNQSIVNDLEAATKVLSDQLYQKSTHFLLELIQNADDNTYTVAEPTLHLTYGLNHLRVDCNEIGFQPNDVEAICSIGQSSKAGAGVSTQYVGEKGIGFKSVFKAADVVWVSSGAYEFKFDKRARLGMIAPILDDFHGYKRAQWTSFYLQLAQDYNSQELVNDLKSLDARLLIFLRRLRTILITFASTDGQQSMKRLTRSEGLIEGKEAIHLAQDEEKMSYIVMRHRAKNLPSVERREGISESELLLAFPVDEGNEPKIDPQQVYAFLPIRDYGFKFLIQADFLLIASREDVDNSSKWNQVLRDNFVDAFLESVKWFNSGSLRYTWPRFLPEKQTSSDFFSPLKSRILQRLAREPILEARSKQLLPASKLIYVPEKYLDDDGIPLTLTASKLNVYISQNYSHEDFQYLKLLDVVEMNDSLFLDHVEEITKHQRDYFMKRPPEWHSRLAAVLAEIWEAPQAETRRRPVRFFGLDDDDEEAIFSSYALRRESLRRGPKFKEPEGQAKRSQERIKVLPLIPLRDGLWVCIEGNNILFPGDSENWEIPGGIDLLVVDPTAAKDRHRAQLFRLLGVKNFNIHNITQLIVSNHSDKAFNPDRVTRQDLISQMRFLFTTGWRNINGVPFWFATEFDSRAPGSTLYIDDTEVPHSASKFFVNNRKRFQFIHSDYEHAHAQDPSGWLEWLKINMSLSNIPRLVRPVREVAPGSWIFEMSPEFEFIINVWSSLDAITLLCHHWTVYQVYIDPLTKEFAEKSVEASYRNLKKKISAISVKCTDGKSCRLDETFLPTNDVPEESKGCVSFLDVPEPEHTRWLHLTHFGVGVKQDVSFYLRCLETLSGSPCELKQATYFYEQIQARSNEDPNKVRKFFHDKKKPIYVPFSRNIEIMPDQGAWFPFNQCLWNGPRCLRVHFSMHDLYPSCKRLFTDILELSDASMRELVFEAVLFKKSDPLDYMRDVFLELEKFLEKDKTYTMRLETLAGKEIWPVTENMERGNFEEVLSTKVDWFIADTEPLLESFTGIVPLLAFTTEDVGRMERLMNGLEMDTRRLSRATKSIPKTEGRVELHREHTAAFQSKYEFIARLVQPSAIDRKRRQRVLRSLQNTEVFTAEHIVQRYLVSMDSKKVEGRQRPGHVVLTPEEDGLKIYLKEQYLELERNPCELVEKLASFTGINERKNGHYLLHVVLTETNPLRITAILADYGVPMSHPEDNGEEEEWLTANRGPKSAFQGMMDGLLPHQYGTESMTVFSSNNAKKFGDGENGFSEDPDDILSSLLDNILGGETPFGPGFRLFAPNRRHNPFNTSTDVVDDDLEFTGENFVSETLAKHMGEKYSPEESWTSKHRIRAGFSRPENVEGSSAFTIKDTQGVWTKIISEIGYPHAAVWKKRPPTWHLEVKTTEGPLEEEFSFSAAQFEKAKKFSIQSQEEKYKYPTDVMIVVRVFNAESEPKLGIFVDPWELYVSGSLQLKSKGSYMARFCG